MTNILTRDARVGLLARRDRAVRPGLVLAVVLIGQFMAVLDASVVNVAVPPSTPACAPPAPACSWSWPATSLPMRSCW